MALTVEHVPELISRSPGWCRVALTASDVRLRHAAADELAALIVERANDPPGPCRDAAQMPLPL